MTGYRNLYDQLLKSGELLDVFPTALGIWEEDRAEFIQLQDELEYLTETPLILDEEDEEEQEDFY
jgi:hypothetical protein